MTKVLKADCSAGDAYIAKTGLNAFATPWWITYQLAMPTATATALNGASKSRSAGFHYLADAGNINTDVLVAKPEVTGTGPWDLWGYLSGAFFTGAFSLDTWHTIQIHWDGTTITIRDVDNAADLNSYTFGSTPYELDLGGNDSWAVGGEIYYIKSCVIGSTAGGSDLFSDGFVGGDLSAWSSTHGGVSLVDDPGFGSVGGATGHASDLPEVTIKIYDLGTTELADISAIALERRLHREKNGPRTFTIQAPAGHSLFTTVAGDGYRNLRRGNRKIVVWEDADPDTDDPIFHGRIRTVERSGDENQALVTIGASDPWPELGFESNDEAGRPVRGSTVPGDPGDPFGGYDGNFINPKFSSSVVGQDAISGPDLILQILTNTQNPEFDTPPFGEGPLPIALTGTFDLDCPPAVDLSCEDTATWPVMIGDFIQQLVDTDVVDVDMRPVRPGTGLNLAGDPDPYIMVELSAVSKQGTDRSGTIHFDWWTGSHNAKACRHVEDFSTILNHLRDLLGPRRDQSHWRADINIGSTGTTEDGSASAALYGGPPGAAHPGRFMQVREYDSIGDEASNRPLYLALWNAEMTNRVEPRDELFVTPVDGAKALFTAPQDFDVGDEVAINVDVALGIALAEKQRVYGYDKTWSREGTPSLSQLVTSADIAGGGG